MRAIVTQDRAVASVQNGGSARVIPGPSLSPAVAGCPTRGLRAVWLLWGCLPDEAAVNAVSERVAASGWIAPHQTRPMRLMSECFVGCSELAGHRQGIRGGPRRQVCAGPRW
jgi:hypothetical protein